jgi:hypothetical protein
MNKVLLLIAIILSGIPSIGGVFMILGDPELFNEAVGALVVLITTIHWPLFLMTIALEVEVVRMSREEVK